MGKLRHVDYYPDEFLVGTSDMDAETKGAYWTICSLIYSKGEPVTDDARWLAKVCGVSIRRWPAVRRAILDTGKIAIQDGRLTNRRCMLEIERAERRSRQATLNGDQGGRPPSSKSPRTPAEVPDELPLEREFSGSSAGVRGGCFLRKQRLGKTGRFLRRKTN